MSLNIKNQTIYAASYHSWNETINSYSSNSYNLQIKIRKGNGTPIDLTINDNENGSFDVSIPSTSVQEFGIFLYSARLIEKADNEKSFIYENGEINILPDVASDSFDPRSNWKIIYDSLIAKYQEMVHAGQIYSEISINGRTKKLDRAQLLAEIHNAGTKAGIENGPRKYKVRFS